MSIWRKHGDLIVAVMLMVLGFGAGALVQRSCYAPSPRDVRDVERELRQRELRLDQLRGDWLERVGQTDSRVLVEDNQIAADERTFEEAMREIEKLNRRLESGDERQEGGYATDSD